MIGKPRKDSQGCLYNILQIEEISIPLANFYAIFLSTPNTKTVFPRVLRPIKMLKKALSDLSLKIYLSIFTGFVPPTDLAGQSLSCFGKEVYSQRKIIYTQIIFNVFKREIKKKY
jgi:hypothetical protein